MAGCHALAQTADPERAGNPGEERRHTMTYTTLTMSQTHDGKPAVLNLPTIKLNKNAKKQLRGIYAHLGGRVLCSIRLRL